MTDGDITTMTVEEWQAKGSALFGPDPLKWKFVCPSCGHVASVQDWKDAGASEGEVGFSCVGRHLKADGTKAFRKKGGPCNYAGGGFFKLNPVAIEGRKDKMFAFAEVIPPS